MKNQEIVCCQLYYILTFERWFLLQILRVEVHS